MLNKKKIFFFLFIRRKKKKEKSKIGKIKYPNLDKKSNKNKQYTLFMKM